MEKIKTYISLMVFVILLLISCKKDYPVAKEQDIVETIDHSLTMRYKGNTFQYTVHYDPQTKTAKASGKYAGYIKKLLDENDYGVVYFREGGIVDFYDNEMVDSAKTHIMKESNTVNNRIVACNSSNRDAICYFYRHTNYVDLMDIRYGGTYSSYPETYLWYTPGYSNINDNWNYGGTLTSNYGFKVANVPSGTNDNLSSLKITSNGFNQSFQLLLFEHGGFGGRCIGFGLGACVNIASVSDLTQWRMVGWFNGSWNDKVSSYQGYYY